MNGFSLMIPFLLIRFGMLAFLGKNGMQRAAHYAPVFGKEKAAYWIYQLYAYRLYGTCGGGFSISDFLPLDHPGGGAGVYR